MKHGRPRKDAIPLVPITGPWEDIGDGTCPRCRVPRLLFRPLMKPELVVCAPCSQVVTISGTPLHRADGLDVEPVDEELDGGDADA